MKRKNARKAITAAVLFCVLIHLAYADTVQLDLFSVGCPSLFDPNNSWSTEIDLGVQFSQIDNVYMDWAGGITAGLAIDYDDPDNPYPQEVGIRAAIEHAPLWRHTSLWGGESTYPLPETFDLQSDFISGAMPWSELYDGQFDFAFTYQELVLLNSVYIEHGSIDLTKANLVVEGVIVPEPATILLFSTGLCLFRAVSA